MRALVLAVFVIACLRAQAVTAVTTAANTQNVVLAPGGVFFVFGNNLGPLQNFSPAPPHVAALGPYGIALRNAEGAETRALMVSAQQSASIGIVPSSLPPGDYELIYLAGTARSRPFPVKVAARSLAFFTRTNDGTGPVTAAAGNRAVGFTTPARPGDMVTMLATGLGATTGRDDRADPRPIEVEIELSVGGKTIQASSAGRSAAGAGLDEVRFVMPEGEEVGEGCYLPVRARIDGVWSNAVTLSKGSAAACVHPLGVDGDALAKLDRGQSLVLANFNLIRRGIDVDIPGRKESASFLVAMGRFFAGDGPLLLRANGRSDDTPFRWNQCFIDTAVFANPNAVPLDDLALSLAVGRPEYLQANAYDGGVRATVTTPTGATIALQRPLDEGTLRGGIDESDAARAAAIAPGEWQVEWPGGTQLGGGKATLNVAETAPLIWDQELTAIDANEELALKWKASGLPSPLRFSLTGVFYAPGAAAGTVSYGSFSCAVEGTEFTVAREVMRQMPAAESGRAFFLLTAVGAPSPFTVGYANGAGRADYAAFLQEAQVARVREYKR